MPLTGSCLYSLAQISPFEGIIIGKVTPENVGRLARRRERENWAFRDRLKESQADTDRIDRIVHELYRQESAAFDCTACANCCKGISPLLDGEDVERLARGLGMTAERVISEYLKKDEEYDGWVFRRMPCPLMNDNICSCYEHRPHDCASYPHLHKDRFVSRASNMIANTAVCPIVFSVFERLKDEFRPGLK